MIIILIPNLIIINSAFMKQSMRFILLFFYLIISTQVFSSSTSKYNTTTKAYDASEFIAPVASFSESTARACIGDMIIFTDASTNIPTSWTWTFSPNTVAYQNGTTTNSQNPEVSFNAVGNYDVTLTASNMDGSNSITRSISILGSSSLPFNEGFTAGVPPPNWGLSNPDGLKGWESATVTGIGGNPTQVARMDNYSYNQPGAIDELITPTLNLMSITNPKLYFNVAYAPYSAANSERLHIEYSIDCGSNFNATTYDKAGATLATVPNQTNGWGPTDPSHWRAETIDISTYKSTQTAFKFIQTNGYGNGLFIDDVRIGTEDPPTANFSYTLDCATSTATFTDTAIDLPTSWAWTFAPSTVTYLNGTTANSQHPQVSFNTIENYTVTLVATNANGSNSISQTIGSYGTATAPYTEDFAAGVPPSNWIVNNPDGLKGWELTTVTGIGGNPTQVARMDNYSYNQPGAMDELIMPAVDFSSITGAYLAFDVAYAPYSAANFERLQIEYSTDCGASFNPTTYDKSGAVLATVGNQTNGWGPTDPSHWRVEIIDLTAYQTVPTMFKFIQTNGYGNGLFIDNVRILTDVLPVELMSFNGKAEACDVSLNWTSATEENFDYYEIQRSRNPRDFSSIARVESEGGIEQQYYEYRDKGIDTDNYYRLKMVDIDGSYEYSKVVFVESGCNKKNGIVSLYPNPVKIGASIQLDFYTEKEEEEIICINSLGIVVKRIKMNTIIGKNSENIDLGDLPAGNYYIKQQASGKGVSLIVL